ncbi:unnamed protein product [Rhizophagus irregularis]|nr:unnamed protein product [Rhizophagus irregularis]CAB5363314.1 unnamed protein product [Rhizophagus irregularis]CAB5393309.1 unnamed protein product [Rhizophagus irregularis]
MLKKYDEHSNFMNKFKQRRQMSNHPTVPTVNTDTTSILPSRNILNKVADFSTLENSSSSPKPTLFPSPQRSNEPISTPTQIPITVFDFSELDTLSTSTKPTLFPPPQSFNEASSSSEGYITADSNDMDSAENIKSPPPALPMVTLDLFNTKSYTPVYKADGSPIPYSFQ